MNAIFRKVRQLKFALSSNFFLFFMCAVPSFAIYRPGVYVFLHIPIGIAVLERSPLS